MKLGPACAKGARMLCKQSVESSILFRSICWLNEEAGWIPVKYSVSHHEDGAQRTLR